MAFSTLPGVAGSAAAPRKHQASAFAEKAASFGWAQVFHLSSRPSSFIKGTARNGGEAVEKWGKWDWKQWETSPKLSHCSLIFLPFPVNFAAVHHPNSMGHTEAPKTITPTRGAVSKHGNPSPQLEAPRRSVGVHHPKLGGHTEVRESIICCTFPKMYFLAISHNSPLFCISPHFPHFPHFPPFPPFSAFSLISPHLSPFFHIPHFPKPLRPGG